MPFGGWQVSGGGVGCPYAPPQVFSGITAEFRHDNHDDPFCEIAVSTMRRGRPSEIRVRLRIETYREAWEWHNAGRAVLVEGLIRRSPGKPGIVDNPARFQPLDELMLPSSGAHKTRTMAGASISTHGLINVGGHGTTVRSEPT